ncbi:ATP-dependent DNA helicase [Caenorhabditis elegans]|uniref:ATP-dependent DNA helicase n=1 Tax=Caenorhabditis elegans TaxID=6239 RepID=Q9U1U3_CAEEL|nr:ATP-dependent DNA helicase [Caenorhabditis elegans]CAB63404.3 ATP-dependent DNA helicase [Caenorhabditis elegans]|eukprot:NP_507648.3 Uncharacterized protein CELE_Y69H2.7 [Caenorhabditis elegans]
MSKKPEKNLKKKAEAASEITFNDNFIQIGNVKLSNIDLRSIVRKSEEISLDDDSETEKTLQNDPDFMKSLDEYASEKSKEIIAATVSSEKIKESPPPAVSSVKKAVNLTKPVTQSINIQVIRKEDQCQMEKNIKKNAKKSGKKSAKSGNGEVLVNPGGSNTPHFATPVDVESLWCQEKDPDAKQLPSLLESKLYLQNADVIARKLLEPSFAYSFQFTVDINFVLTGIVRQCKFTYSGRNTFKSFNYMFKHKYCESENFQLFYMNHEGRFMEVHDTLTLKQMLIVHGAFPKGIYNNLRGVGQLLCIPRCNQTEDDIFDRESDLILGAALAKNMTRQEAQMNQHLLFQMAPDRRFFELAQSTVHYSEAELLSAYNQYDEPLQLVLFCQKTQSSQELFEDARKFDPTEIELKNLLADRFHQPYDNCTGEESVNLEVKLILEHLKKSRFQTRSALDYIEKALRNEAVKLIKSGKSKKNQ